MQLCRNVEPIIKMYSLIAVIVLLFSLTEAQDTCDNQFIVTPCTCGKRRIANEPRIEGGDPTIPNEFTVMVAILYVPQFVRSVNCGGTILSENYVLTAAHCVKNIEVSNLQLVVGEHDITVQDNPWRQILNASSYTWHPYYDPNTNDFDIAVIKVSGKIEFNSHVSPVCLPYKYVNWDLTGMDVWLTGWGLLNFGGQTSNVLRKVDVKIISQALCWTKVPTLTTRQICTQATGKDSCQFDSGGPALYHDAQTGSLFQIGIISFGKYCAIGDHPGVNTRVTLYLNWIEHFAPADYCHK